MNKKGMTLVEIIVSISLVTVILAFLINLLITVKDFDNNTQNASEMLINQAVITREAQKDFIDYGLVGVSACTSEDVTARGLLSPVPSGATNIYCLKFTYDSSLVTDNIGYLLSYTYNYDGTNTKSVIGYKRGTNQAMRDAYTTLNPATRKGTVSSSCSTQDYSKCSLRIDLPVIDNNLNDYSITLTYIYDKNNFNYNKSTNAYGFEFK